MCIEAFSDEHSLILHVIITKFNIAPEFHIPYKQKFWQGFLTAHKRMWNFTIRH